MASYESFAQVYDLFMDNVPYGEWASYLVRLLRENGIVDGLVLDLGCGTGTMTRLLERAGYDMIGVDNSGEMLEIARAAEGEESAILYLLQDMREFELYGTVRAVVSVCDCVNYITDEEELCAVFRLVNNYLDPGGLFIFDLNTVYKYEQGSFIWDNYYDEESGINEYDLTLFVREEGDLYRKYEETHYQRAYETDTVCALLGQAGLELVALYDAFTGRPVREDSERILVVARECGKRCRCSE